MFDLTGMLPPGLQLLSALLPPSFGLNGLWSGSVDFPSQNSVLSRRLPPLLRAAITVLDDLEEEEKEEERRKEEQSETDVSYVCVRAAGPKRIPNVHGNIQK